MGSDNDANITNSSSSHVNIREDYSTESSSNYSVSKSNIPSYSKILVPHDGKEISDKALNHAIYISNFSGAEVVILRIIEDIQKLGDTSVSVSQNKEIENKKGFKHSIEGELVNSMEEKIRKCVEAGSKNKISYEIKTGHVVHEIVKACKETSYDLVVITTSHLDSWLRSIFSESRKIISSINTPVLIIH
ncbi:MAG TPA: universal stress protein [Nitrososphaeraceae archaeon]|nr:universal stress protein [Nitrososphaeraceae archaeon]